MLTVRFEPLPPKRMFAFGTSVGLDDDPLTSRLLAADSASPAVNAIAPVEVSSGVLRSMISEITGGVLLETVSLMLPIGTSSTRTRSKIALGPAEVGPMYIRAVAPPLPVVIFASGLAGFTPVVDMNSFMVPLAPVPLVHSTQR